MTQPNILELAKQGNAEAITTLMNRQLQPKGITVKAVLKEGCLQVMLESSQVPDEQAMVAFVCKGMTSLGAKSITKLRIYGKQAGEDFPAWVKEFILRKNNEIKVNPQPKPQIETPLPSQMQVPPSSLPSKVKPKSGNNTDDPNFDLASLITDEDLDLNMSELINELSVSPKPAPRQISKSLPTQAFTNSELEPSTEMWRCVHTLRGHSCQVKAVVFNSDGKTLASGGIGTKDAIKIWNIKTGKEICTIREHDSWVCTLAFSPDGQILATDTGGHQTIKLWNWQTGNEIRTIGALSLGKSD